MLICPNKNLKEWKDLVASVGENRAMLMWYESEGKVGFTLSAQTTILDNLSKVNNWFKQMKDTDAFWNKLQKDLQIPKEQISLLKESNGKTIEEKLTNFVVNYSYTVEINTAKEKLQSPSDIYNFNIDGDNYSMSYYQGVEEDYTSYFKNNEEISYEEYSKAQDKYLEVFKEKIPTQHYSNLTVPGGTNYTENEIATPAITPSIKGHAQFSTDNGIGWFRSDDKVIPGEDYDELLWEEEGYSEPGVPYQPGKKTIQRVGKYDVTKTRRILEVQSDLFQKGRDSKVLSKKLEIKKVGDTFLSNGEKFTVTNIDTDSELYELITIQDSQGRTATMRRTQLEKRFDERGDVSSENQFLQLLNKDNNWVTFFIKAVIQDSAKKGYEKVLFPTGNTASKIEGHSTLEEFKRAKEARVKELEESKNKDAYSFTDDYGQKHTVPVDLDKINNEINQLKQELETVEREGFGALKPIYNFYENTVTNILKKQGLNPVLVTDEYGNTWNEVELSDDLLENFTIGSFKPRIPIPIPINNSLEELYREDVENSNNTCTFDIGK